LTWKDLKRFIISHFNYNNEQKGEIKLQQSAERFRIFKDLPFWISDIEEHKKADIANNGKCCFNRIIGLPKKDGIDKPIFDYEMELVNALDNNKSVFVKKARGLGTTEILLLYMSWLFIGLGAREAGEEGELFLPLSSLSIFSDRVSQKLPSCISNFIALTSASCMYPEVDI
jgi:hypothetical protein